VLSNEQRAVVRRSFATTALRDRRFEDALRDVDGALALHGDDAESVRLRAEVFERTERLVEAEADLARAIAMQPESAAAHFARARVLRRLGRAEEAEREQRIHAALQPFEEIVSKAFYKDWPRRIELRRELIDAFPEFRRARHLLVRELLGGGELDAALAELDRLIAEREKDVEAWFLLARVRAKRGEPEPARAAADRMLELDPRRNAVHADLLQEIARGPDAAR
jgi:tetratricopeptide (TPR) repeat protein